MKTVAVSGGFDPLHIGHLRMFQEARDLGDRLVVIVNNDNWLKTKKDFVFMAEDERAEIIRSYAFVDQVIVTDHIDNDPDRSVCRALEQLKPDIFANGGDRYGSNIPEFELCQRLGIEMAFLVGGAKTRSSSHLTNRIRLTGVTEVRPWGEFTLYHKGENFWLKKITIAPGQQTSLQKHRGRGELWMCIDGHIQAIFGDGRTKDLKAYDVTRFAAGVTHRLKSQSGGTVIEIGYGECDESDIIRLEDEYGRI